MQQQSFKRFMEEIQFKPAQKKYFPFGKRQLQHNHALSVSTLGELLYAYLLNIISTNATLKGSQKVK